MISYLIYSSISLGVLYLIYRLFLESEKRFTFNRIYLILCLIFSFSIPLIPVGVPQTALPWAEGEPAVGAESTAYFYLPDGSWLNGTAGQYEAGQQNQARSSVPVMGVLMLYLCISSLLFIRLIRILHIIQMKIRRNPKRLVDGCELVLLNENIIPHTFINSVFLNRKRYEEGAIPYEVMVHEFTHVKQKHTLDILFIEFLKVIFWFNPLLYLYKRSMSLNHEYLADEAVLASGTPVRDYQKLLLKTIQGRTLHGLVSTFNFTLTKRRLQMMTKSKSTFQFILKCAMLLPLFAGLSLLLGCESISNEHLDENETAAVIDLEITASDNLVVDGTMMTLEEFETMLAERDQKPELVNFKVDDNATFGFITDVQMVLRRQEAFRINYSVNRDQKSDSLEEVTARYLKAAEEYMKLNPHEAGKEGLQQEYELVLEFYEAIKRVENIGPEAPPPPPLVPSPGQRLGNENGEVKNADVIPSPPVPPSTVKANNHLQILMNRQGMMLMDDKPVTMDEIEARVTQFVRNKGEDPKLSDSPQQALISIKTAPDTPYDLYKELIGNVKGAYDVLRNEASLNRFGVQFSELTEGESEQSEIDDDYPIRIVVEPPNGA
jgi:biopolymer transport protein ExbD